MALILESLQAGEWKPGVAIPSEMDLAARFRVSQGTVRKALAELAAVRARKRPGCRSVILILYKIQDKLTGQGLPG